MIRKIFFPALIAACGIFASCKKESPLHHLIQETDVCRVYIYSGNQIAVKYFTNDIEKIKEWCDYIADDTASANNCSFEGRLVFKVYEDSTVMQFSLKPGCRVVSYSLNDVHYTKSLTPEGVNYLEGLKKVE
ncbi:MAG TPA: hypothetical protein VE978_16095 [Chitinophagales bacterium]|nr:hypothetical protein [Chitinophagales bacterium]